MLASNNKTEFKDFNTFKTNHGNLLKSNLIYGANASGKTNLIKAIDNMRDMVLYSDNEIHIKNIEPFQFQVQAKSIPTKFEISFMIEEILYEYGFEVLESKIHSEWLYKKASRKTLLLSRESPEYNSIHLAGELNEAEQIKKFVGDTSLFITVASKFNIHLAKVIKDWFTSIYILINSNPLFTARFIQESLENQTEVLKHLKYADFGIEDIDVDIEELSADRMGGLTKFNQMTGIEKGEKGPKIVTIDINTVHTVYNEKNIESKLRLPYSKHESKGTQKFFDMIGPIIMALNEGRIIILDEIDARLHCSIVRYILSFFNSIDRNPNNAQLICNTHDVLLLEENIRRDQIWFVQKNSFGESELYSLNEFSNIRKDDPILKKYLLGTFGAVPFSRK
jgi:AAA15 family ATPase/GTPase